MTAHYCLLTIDGLRLISVILVLLGIRWELNSLPNHSYQHLVGFDLRVWVLPNRKYTHNSRGHMDDSIMMIQVWATVEHLASIHSSDNTTVHVVNILCGATITAHFVQLLFRNDDVQRKQFQMLIMSRESINWYRLFLCAWILKYDTFVSIKCDQKKASYARYNIVLTGSTLPLQNQSYLALTSVF